MAEFRVDAHDPLPLYYQVYSSLLRRIRAREFSAGAALPAERRLALDYGVSRITITRALDELAREGYVDQRQGRGTFVLEVPAQPPAGYVAAGRTVGLIGPDWDEPYPFALMHGILKECVHAGCALHIASDTGDPLEERRLIESLLGCGADGMIVYPAAGHDNIGLFAELAARRYPFVLMDRYYPEVQTDRVVFEDEVAGYELTRCLIEAGHRRIAVLHYLEVEVTSVRERLTGYRRALEAHGIPYQEDLVWLDVYARSPVQRLTSDRDAERARLHALLRRHRPTALLTLNHEAAELAVQDLAALPSGNGAGLAGPEIATVSHLGSPDGLPLVTWCALQSGERLGAEAARLLLDRMADRDAGSPRCIQTPMEIIALRPSPMLHSAAT